MSRKNGNKLINSTLGCPFCANPRFIADRSRGKAKKISVLWPRWRLQEKFWSEKILKLNDDYGHLASVVAEQRGESLRIVLEGDDFKKHWRDFVVEVFGIESVGEIIYPRKFERVWDNPPQPFLFVESTYQGPNQAALTRQFFACRITHKHTLAELIVHWWPTHGRLFEMRGPLVTQEPNSDIEAFKTAFDFFQRETRGAPKIKEVELVGAIRRLGTKATQAATAKEIGVSPQALRQWAARKGIHTWGEVKSQYKTTAVF